MAHEVEFYIGGRWRNAGERPTIDVINPSNEELITSVAAGTTADIDGAIEAARAAFPSFSASTKNDRVDLLREILAIYNSRARHIGAALMEEIGTPQRLTFESQVPAGAAQIASAISALEKQQFIDAVGATRILREPIGVCGLITPWNWPPNQIMSKVAAALAAGCTMVLKPSEVAPLSALLLAEILHDAGTPPGVFNMVNGYGPELGGALAEHPAVDMISLTGSTRSGVSVSRAAAASVKRVHLELGGKSPNIILSDADLNYAVSRGVEDCFLNSGQCCDAPTRMLVPEERYDEVIEIAAATAARVVSGPPDFPESQMGPVSTARQFEKVQGLIQTGISEGAQLITGGLGRPHGIMRGYFVRPTVFGNVTPSMKVAREEIFGPVLTILRYRSEDEAVAIANDTEYGLAAYVQSSDLERAHRIARRLRVGMVHINYPDYDYSAPFGGYKRSGNGRECGTYGIAEFLEVKAVIGYGRSKCD